MTGKEELEYISVLQNNIDEQKLYVHQLESMLDGVSAIQYDKERVDSTPSDDPILQKLLKLDNEKEKLQHMTDRLIKQKWYCIDLIHEVKDIRYQKILYMVYIEGMSLVSVSKKMGYVYGYTRDLCSKALKCIDKI